MDIQLHCAVSGAGKPLILLHGNGESGEYFVRQTAAFSQNYMVYALDTRGHGKSPRGTAPFTIQQFAEDLRCFMDANSLEKASLLGFSDGGNIALAFALKYPDRVEKLILCGANLSPAGVKLPVQLPIVIGYRIALLFARWSPAAQRNAEILGLMVNEPNIRGEELQKLDIPTLVIAGTRDMIREEHTKRICSGIPGARLAIIPGNHFVAAKNPGPFNQTVLEFLSKT